MNIGDRVIIETLDGPKEGTVSRLTGKYVTVLITRPGSKLPSTYVRLVANVRPVETEGEGL